MPRFAPVFRFTLLVASLLLLACGGGSSGPRAEACKNKLIEVDGQCICPDKTVFADCCLTSSDCAVGCTCDLTVNYCACSIPDGDHDLLDGDETDTVEAGDETDLAEESEQSDAAQDGDESEAENAEPDHVDPEPEAERDTDSDQESGPCTRLYGLGALLDFNTLPCPQPQAIIQQSSTRDPNCGSDDYRVSDLGKSGNEWILMDSKRPGCLNRIYFGGTGTNIDNALSSATMKFYFDGNLSLTTNLLTITQGTTAPFLTPLVGRYYQSFYSYVPLCFEKSLRVTLVSDQLITPKGFEFTYTNYPDATGLKTYTPNSYATTELNRIVAAYTTTLGQDPKVTVAGQPSSRTETGIKPGDAPPFFNYGLKPSVVTSLKIFISPKTPDILNNTYLEIFWEDKPTPDVSVPVGLFFGSGFEVSEFKSLFLGMSPEGEWYSYFPMPFWKKMNIRLRNASQSIIDSAKISLVMQDNPYSEGQVGFFRATYNEAQPVAKDSPSYPLLDVTGQGQIVGVSMALSSPPSITSRQFLLGDSLLRIDGLATPVLHGVGTDAFFNGSQLFSLTSDPEPAFLPLFSVAVNSSEFKYAARRLFLTDAIPFQAQASLSLEHGDQNQQSANYRSVVYYYQSCLNAIELIDTFDLTNTDDQNSHVLNFPSDALKYSGESLTFQEDACAQTTTLDSRFLANELDTKTYFEFYVIHVPAENQGLRLSRLFDYGSSGNNQGAKVFVIDTLGMTEVGTWYDGGHYTKQSGGATLFKESVFEIPAQYTSGKTTLHLRVQYDSGDRWNVHSFKAYAYRRQESGAPGKVDAATITYYYDQGGVNPCLRWQKPSDGTVPDSYLIYRGTASNFTADAQSIVGTASTTEWCDSGVGLDPAHYRTYYYRIRASDCTGKAGVVSMDKEIPLGVPPVCFEAEDTLAPNANATIVADASASGGKYVLYTPDACAANALFYFSKTLDESSRGIHYRLTTTLVEGPTMGEYTPAIDGSQVAAINTFAATQAFRSYPLREDYEAPSTTLQMQLRFRCKSASAGGKSFAVDNICLSGKGPQRKAAPPSAPAPVPAEKSFLEELFPWW